MNVSKRILPFILPMILLLSFIGLGIQLIDVGTARTYLILQSQNWAATSGKIIESKVSILKVPGKSFISYKPEISYQYEVKGTIYENNRLSYSDEKGKDYAEEKVVQYAAGSDVKVFYNPDSPTESCLEVSGQFKYYLLLAVLGIAVVFTGFGLFGWLGIIENYKKMNK